MTFPGTIVVNSDMNSGFATNQYGKTIKMDGQWLVNGYDMEVTIDMEKPWFQ